MISQAVDEAALIRDLREPANLPGAAGPVEFASTHASLVFLARDAVFKVKRRRNYGFLDYSTPEKRRHFCEEEVRLNRRTAPDVYLGVLPVREDAAGCSLTRPGAVVDHAVWMRRLPDDRSALALLRRGRLDREDLAAVARDVAAFHRRAEEHPGSADVMGRNLEENFAQVKPYVGRFVGATLFRVVEDRSWAWFERHRQALDARPFRDGHGDLRLEHVYLLPAGPVLIDCIEFADRFRIADPAIDAAFLAMDLFHHRRADLAEWFLARFAAASDDFGFYPLIDGYLAYRAWVRGKVACFVADDPGTPEDLRRRKSAEAGRMFELARELVERRPGKLVLAGVGGLIASGKTTVAGRLSERHCVPVVSADVVRKSRAGLPLDAPGPPALYDAAFRAATLDAVLERAGSVLRGGRSVIVDTTFQERAFRDRARRLAAAHGARFLFVECRAPEAILRARLEARRGGPSDARAGLLDAFLAGYEPPAEVPAGEHVVVDTSLPPAGLVLPRLPSAAAPREAMFRPEGGRAGAAGIAAGPQALTRSSKTDLGIAERSFWSARR